MTAGGASSSAGALPPDVQEQLRLSSVCSALDGAVGRLEAALAPGTPASQAAAATDGGLVRLRKQAAALRAALASASAASAAASSAAAAAGDLPAQLVAFGGAVYAALPHPRCCGNAACRNLDAFSEAALANRACSGCRAVKFCSAACLRAAWKAGHKAACPLLKQRREAAAEAAP